MRYVNEKNFIYGLILVAIGFLVYPFLTQHPAVGVWGEENFVYEVRANGEFYERFQGGRSIYLARWRPNGSNSIEFYNFSDERSHPIYARIDKEGRMIYKDSFSGRALQRLQ